MKHMNILVTLDAGYLAPLTVMLRSLADNNRCGLDVYIMNSELNREHLDQVMEGVTAYCGEEVVRRLKLIDIKVDPSMLEGAPITDRYPQEMYYRIFAARFLPRELDRILYLDPDMVVINSLQQLYDIDMGDKWFAAASHVGRVLEKINELRLQSEEPGPYINSGVIVMDLRKLRLYQNEEEVFDYIEKNKNLLILPDQDVISALYGGRICEIDPYRYNMTERLLTIQLPTPPIIDLAWICQNTAVVHYCGRNKPWKDLYVGKLDIFYHWYARIR